MIVQQLSLAIAAVCPISGVSIGRADDKATWRIDFAETATPAQQIAAQAVLDAFIYDPALDTDIDIENVNPLAKAVSLMLRDYCNALDNGTYRKKSVAQLKADFTARISALDTPDPVPTAAELQLLADLVSVRGNNPIITFLQMSPTEIDAYINTNVTGANAASVTAIKTILAVLCKVVSVTTRAQIK